MKSEAHIIEVYLTRPQYKKFESHQPFQMTYQQIVHPDHHHGDHHVEIHLAKKEFTKLSRNIKNQKGFRFKPENILGGSFFGRLKDLGKKAVSFAKDNIPKDLVKQGVDYAVKHVAERTGQHDIAHSIGRAVHSKIDQQYDNGMIDNGEGFGDFLKKGFNTVQKIVSNPVVADLGKQALNAGLNYASNSSNPTLAGIANTAKLLTGGKLKKGSQEAKEKMARIRAMRGRKGDGFGDFFRKGLNVAQQIASNPIAQQIGKQALNTGLNYASNSSNPTLAGIANTAKLLTGGKLKKGSQEAKEKMARIRAMRGRKGDGFNFGNFFRSVGNKIGDVAKTVVNSPVTKQIGQTALQTAVPLALTLATANPETAPLAMIAQSALANQQQGPPSNSQVGNGLRHKRYKNDCSPFVNGTPMPITITRRGGRVHSGGSFAPL